MRYWIWGAIIGFVVGIILYRNSETIVLLLVQTIPQMIIFSSIAYLIQIRKLKIIPTFLIVISIIFLAYIYFFVGVFCTQNEVYGKNIFTGEVKDFANPCHKPWYYASISVEDFLRELNMSSFEEYLLNRYYKYYQNQSS
ncbi:MAG: hypothetical protein QXM85_00590 [Candidatus Aenigmatarchaeota archaeon]